MSNTATKIALVFLVLAVPAAAFARAGGSTAGSAGLAARGALIGSAQMLDQSGRKSAPAVAPLPPPRISVPAIPKFK
jgi:hypothetical protein